MGSILVSVNPFKALDMCTSDTVLQEYINAPPNSNLPPHVYALAKNAYAALDSGKYIVLVLKGGLDVDSFHVAENQSCIVSGESGAGKTEATKIFLRYITMISSGAAAAADKGESVGSLQERLLSSNPVMESFGNAKTVRNDNSSRFGKFIRILFSKQKDIIGGSVKNYLLEKSRVVKQSPEERNYHIFYELLSYASSSPDYQALCGLEDVDLDQDFNYLQGEFGREDRENWDKLLESMDTLAMSGDEQKRVFQLVAVILLLGQVDFESTAGDDEASVFDSDSQADVAKVCKALQLESTQLEQALCKRSIKVPGQTEPIWKPRSTSDALETRDVLSKAIYSAVFDHLILLVNKSLKGRASTTKSRKAQSRFIGVLDIFGFEFFETNSFEQLCINYCNEKLQHHFNQHIFEIERKDYTDYNVDVSVIEFKNNEDCVDLLEARAGKGILSLIDEQQKLKFATDASLLKQLSRQFDEHPYFGSPQKLNTDQFSVKHYAGSVHYNVMHFIRKNMDLVHEDILHLFQQSKNTLMKELFPKPKGGKNQKPTRKTIGAKFHEQLKELVDTLNTTQPHFIRCIKPNDEKLPDSFTSTIVLDQLNYAGLLEVCRIRKIGYPVRKDCSEFHARYKALAPYAQSCDALCQELVKIGVLVPNEFQLGQNKRGNAKVFLRSKQFDDLETAYEFAVNDLAQKIQRFYRLCAQRHKEKLWLSNVAALKAVLKGDSIQKIEHSLATVRETYPFSSRVVRVLSAYPYHVQRCSSVMLAQARISELERGLKLENNVSEVLMRVQHALDSSLPVSDEDTESLKMSLVALEEGYPSSKLLSRGKEVILLLNCNANLRNALIERNWTAVRTVLQRDPEIAHSADGKAALNAAATIVQKNVRCFLCRKEYLYVLSLYTSIRAEERKLQRTGLDPQVNAQLETLLKEAEECPLYFRTILEYKVALIRQQITKTSQDVVVQGAIESAAMLYKAQLDQERETQKEEETALKKKLESTRLQLESAQSEFESKLAESRSLALVAEERAQKEIEKANAMDAKRAEQLQASEEKRLQLERQKSAIEMRLEEVLQETTGKIASLQEYWQKRLEETESKLREEKNVAVTEVKTSIGKSLMT